MSKRYGGQHSPTGQRPGDAPRQTVTAERLEVPSFKGRKPMRHGAKINMLFVLPVVALGATLFSFPPVTELVAELGGASPRFFLAPGSRATGCGPRMRSTSARSPAAPPFRESCSDRCSPARHGASGLRRRLDPAFGDPDRRDRGRAPPRVLRAGPDARQGPRRGRPAPDRPHRAQDRGGRARARRDVGRHPPRPRPPARGPASTAFRTPCARCSARWRPTRAT
jgi:hypothetical protein